MGKMRTVDCGPVKCGPKLRTKRWRPLGKMRTETEDRVISETTRTANILRRIYKSTFCTTFGSDSRRILRAVIHLSWRRRLDVLVCCLQLLQEFFIDVTGDDINVIQLWKFSNGSLVGLLPLILPQMSQVDFSTSSIIEMPTAISAALTC